MSRRRKNIAILLFWIFFFPIVFQALHIGVHSNAGVHNHELSNHYVTKQAFSHNYTIESQHEESCPICDYQFSINDIPKTSFFTSVFPLTRSILKELKIRLPFQILFSQKSPRAPPVILE